jgi:release factor glutamine methyltransferase
MVYEPAEDSFLLQKFVKKYARGLVLDMGTGSGIQAKTAAETADLVIGLDIDKDAVKYCKKNIDLSNVHFFKSNLFQAFDENFFFYCEVDKRLEVFDKKKIKDREQLQMLVKKQIKFDLVVFNPPYLPQELQERDVALEGGKKGYEVLQRFFNKVSEYLKKDGRIVVLFSSFTNKQRVNDCIHKNGLRYIELEKKHIFFEDLYVYYVTRP